MCGIVGYTGNREAQPVLLKAIAHLEYRGYDSSGIAVKDGCIRIYKDKVRVAQLLSDMPRFHGNSGIGHTRWATHGEPSQINSHPHCDCTGRIAVVHNGVITNYLTLKEQLIREGHRFVSETDTEVISHLIEKYYTGDIEMAVRTALQEVVGSYAIVVLNADNDQLIAAKNGNPLIIGVGDGQNLVASDVPALLDHTDRVIYMEDSDLAVITAGMVSIKNNGVVVSRPVRKITWGPADIQKNGYEHFMMKEIHEQPRIIRETFQTIATTENPAVNSLISKEPNLVLILACGTSYHAGLVGRYIIEGLLNIPVRTELASEVNHRDNIVFVNDVIAITQSGETADVLYSLKRLKEIGAHIAAITNVHDNSVSRLADDCIYTAAGPEISVAATKTFMAQLTALYQIVLSHPRINGQKREELTAEAKLLPHKVQRIIDNDTSIAECGKYLSNYHDVFFIGRGINYPIALEGALKMKEISYIHAEGYAAGELKHGPFSLLQRDTPVIAIVNKDKTYDAMLANIKEIKSRGSPVIAIIAEDDDVTGQLVDTVIKVPRTLNIFTPIVNTVAVQLLAYYTAKYNGCSIDFPRNLAKSVTVE